MSLTPLIKSRLESSLETQDPLSFYLPQDEFNMPEFQEKLASKLHLEGLKISVSKPKKKAAEKNLEGLGKNPLVYRLQMSSFEDSPFIVASQSDADELLSWFLQNGDYPLGSEQEGFQEAVFQFVLAESIQEFEASHYIPETKIRLEDEPLAEQNATVYDLFVECNERTVQFRLICPLTFIQSLEAMKKPQKLTLDQLAEKRDIPLTVSLTLGRVQLKRAEWNSIQIGDWLRLDQCSYKPNEKKGLFILEVFGTPVFHAKQKEGRLKLIDYALELAGESMDYYENEPSSFENEEPHEAPQSEEHLEDEIHEENEESFEQEEPAESPASPTPQVTLEALEKAPLDIRIEAGRINISLKKLLSLEPGSVLETSIQPEMGVTLCVGQTPVARGELVEVGDFLGVRITEIGSN